MREGAKIKLARHFRKAMTHAEVLLWLSLKGHSREGFSFRKQHPVGPYIADFTARKPSWSLKWMGKFTNAMTIRNVMPCVISGLLNRDRDNADFGSGYHGGCP